MKIKIIDRSICDRCNLYKCNYVNSILKQDFFSLRTESTVCPVSYLIDKPTFVVQEGNEFSEKCILCGLCVKACPLNNLEFDYESIEHKSNSDLYKLNREIDERLENLSEQQYNAIAMDYLNLIFGFGANTNRNGSIDFDGYLSFTIGNLGIEAFVEVDYNNDSLESCRRLLKDFLIYKGQYSTEVNNGIIVLKDFPEENSRDIYNLIKNIKNFPYTEKKNIYITTFDILREVSIFKASESFDLSLFFSPKEETLNEYKKRLEKKLGQ